jgi:hypothetical protein
MAAEAEVVLLPPSDHGEQFRRISIVVQTVKRAEAREWSRGQVRYWNSQDMDWPQIRWVVEAALYVPSIG